MIDTRRGWRSGFGALIVMYLTTYAGEGLLVMYLFNNVRINGLDVGISALFALLSYVPSLVIAPFAANTHSRLPLQVRLKIMSLLRALACVGLVASGAYMSVWVTIIFILVMEVLWYALMPCFDELENAAIHDVGTGRGESILTITLQAALSLALLTGGLLFDTFGAPVVLVSLAALQLVPIFVYPRKSLAQSGSEGSSHQSDEKGSVDDVSLLPLLVGIGVTATIPQLVNILFPIKTFSLTDLSLVAGGIDAAYNVGALLVALIGLGAFLHRMGSIRTTGVATMLIASVALATFALSSSPMLLGGAYLCLGFSTTLCRVRMRSEMFSRLRGAGSSRWYSRITNMTLACCTGGTVVLGVVGRGLPLESCYAVIVAVALIGAAASSQVKPSRHHQTS